jgi:hypothetical protein
MDRSHDEPNGLPARQPARQSKSPPREMTIQETFRVPRELQSAWDLSDPQSEIKLRESIRESEFVEELTHRFSDESPQSGPTPPPGIETVRRSPVWLFRSSQLPKNDLQAFIPELNVLLDPRRNHRQRRETTWASTLCRDPISRINHGG